MSEFYTNAYVRGKNVFVRGYRDGSKFFEKKKYRPHLFVQSKSGTSDWEAFVSREKVDRVDFDDINDARDFVKTYKDVAGFKIFGQTNYVSQYISSKWTKDIPFDESRIDSMVIDIETKTEAGFPNIRRANEEILLISCKRKGRKTVTFSATPVEGPPLNCEYRLYKSEHSMLVAFIEYIGNNTPDVITGWNVEGFDIPYLCVRIFNQVGEDAMKKLSPFGHVNMREVEVMGRDELRFEICGIAVLDYLAMYKKFTFKPRESYKLDFIGEVELDQKKLDHSEYDTFKEFYEGDFHKFVAYNIIDCEIVENLDAKLNLLSLAYGVAYKTKTNFIDCFSPIKTWESYIYNALNSMKIVIPISTKRNKREAFGGGYVKPTLSGFYKWVVTFDLTSMYPHLIMLCNISPESIVPLNWPLRVDKLLQKETDLSEAKKLGYSVCGNGQLFDNSVEGIFPKLMHDLFTVRNDAKNEMKRLKKIGDDADKLTISSLDTKQGAIKVLLNSLFGAAGNPYFKYYDIRMAEGITLTGQLAIQWVERKMNEYMNKIIDTDKSDFVIASDTDSIMVNFGPFVEKFCSKMTDEEIVNFLDEVCEGAFSSMIKDSFTELSEYLNAKEQAMHMKRENICDRGLFLKKKRYILNVWDSEGYRYKKPDPKVMGIELVKSSMPAIVRKSLKESIPTLMYGTEKELQDYVKTVKEKFLTQSVEDISFPRGVSDVDKWYSSSTVYISRTPINSRASILHNEMVKKLGLENRIEPIKNGDKIKYVYLRTPNHLGENVIGYIGKLPPEFGLHEYVDYEKQFQSSFMDALNAMLLPMGWDSTKKASMAKWGI